MVNFNQDPAPFRRVESRKNLDAFSTIHRVWIQIKAQALVSEKSFCGFVSSGSTSSDTDDDEFFLSARHELVKQIAGSYIKLSELEIVMANVARKIMQSPSLLLINVEDLECVDILQTKYGFASQLLVAPTSGGGAQLVEILERRNVPFAIANSAID